MWEPSSATLVNASENGAPSGNGAVAGSPPSIALCGCGSGSPADRVGPGETVPSRCWMCCLEPSLRPATGPSIAPTGRSAQQSKRAKPKAAKLEPVERAGAPAVRKGQTTRKADASALLLKSEPEAAQPRLRLGVGIPAPYSDRGARGRASGTGKQVRAVPKAQDAIPEVHPKPPGVRQTRGDGRLEDPGVRDRSPAAAGRVPPADAGAVAVPQLHDAGTRAHADTMYPGTRAYRNAIEREAPCLFQGAGCTAESVEVNLDGDHHEPTGTNAVGAPDAGGDAASSPTESAMARPNDGTHCPEADGTLRPVHGAGGNASGDGTLPARAHAAIAKGNILRLSCSLTPDLEGERQQLQLRGSAGREPLEGWGTRDSASLDGVPDGRAPADNAVPGGATAAAAARGPSGWSAKEWPSESVAVEMRRGDCAEEDDGALTDGEGMQGARNRAQADLSWLLSLSAKSKSFNAEGRHGTAKAESCALDDKWDTGTGNGSNSSSGSGDSSSSGVADGSRSRPQEHATGCPPAAAPPPPPPPRRRPPAAAPPPPGCPGREGAHESEGVAGNMGEGPRRDRQASVVQARTPAHGSFDPFLCLEYGPSEPRGADVGDAPQVMPTEVPANGGASEVARVQPRRAEPDRQPKAGAAGGRGGRGRGWPRGRRGKRKVDEAGVLLGSLRFHDPTVHESVAALLKRKKRRPDSAPEAVVTVKREESDTDGAPRRRSGGREARRKGHGGGSAPRPDTALVMELGDSSDNDSPADDDPGTCRVSISVRALAPNVPQRTRPKKFYACLYPPQPLRDYHKLLRNDRVKILRIRNPPEHPCLGQFGGFAGADGFRRQEVVGIYAGVVHLEESLDNRSLSSTPLCLCGPCRSRAHHLRAPSVHIRSHGGCGGSFEAGLQPPVQIPQPAPMGGSRRHALPNALHCAPRAFAGSLVRLPDCPIVTAGGWEMGVVPPRFV